MFMNTTAEPTRQGSGRGTSNLNGKEKKGSDIRALWPPRAKGQVLQHPSLQRPDFRLWIQLVWNEKSAVLPVVRYDFWIPVSLVWAWSRAAVIWLRKKTTDASVQGRRTAKDRMCPTDNTMISLLWRSSMVTNANFHACSADDSGGSCGQPGACGHCVWWPPS